MEFSWQNGRQLGGMQLSDETAVSYQYNSDGIRIGKTVNDTEASYFVDASGTMQAMKQGDEELVFMYDATGRREGFIWYHDGQKQGTYYYLYNVQSDVIGMVAEDMSPVVTYEYDAWGKLLSVSGEQKDTVGKLNPFRYRGYVYEEEGGLYYVTSRYYDPEVGRFLNIDSMLAGNEDLLSFNLFTYCGTNPVNRIDPTGRSFIAIVGLTLLIGGVIWGCTGSSSVTVSKKTFIDPSLPPPPSSGYRPPKKNPNPQKVRNPNGSGKGWPSQDGGVWIPDNKQHGGAGWTEQFPGGKHKHHYPDGHIREISPESIQWNSLIGAGLIIVGFVASAYIIVNDITGIGVADDWMLGPAGGLIAKGGILLFS